MTEETNEPERHPCPECGKYVTLTKAGKPRSHRCDPQPKQEQAPPGKITADMVIEAYVKTRDEIAERKKKLKEELAELEALQEKRGNWLKGKMDDLGVESLKGKHGTVFIDFKDSATVADWDRFFGWVREEEHWDFLERRVSKTAVKQMLDDGEAPPPGVNYTKIKDVKIRRS